MNNGGIVNAINRVVEALGKLTPAVNEESNSGWIKYSTVLPSHDNATQADDPTYIITFAGVDLTSIISVGMKIKIKQSTDKFFIVTAISYSTNTTITLYGGTDYDLVDTDTTPISEFYYSSQNAFGFPMDPNKWTIESISTVYISQATPTQNQWYNLGSFSLDIPIGCWEVIYQMTAGADDSNLNAIALKTTLSTANNSESDPDFTNYLQFTPIGTGQIELGLPSSRKKTVKITAKTKYYLNECTTITNVDRISEYNNSSKGIIRAVCAYL